MIIMPYGWPWPIAAAHSPGGLLVPRTCNLTTSGNLAAAAASPAPAASLEVMGEQA